MYIQENNVQKKVEKMLSCSAGRVFSVEEGRLLLLSDNRKTKISQYIIVTDSGFAININNGYRHVEKMSFSDNSIIAGYSKKKFFTRQKEGILLARAFEEDYKEASPFLVSCVLLGPIGELLYCNGNEPNTFYAHSFPSIMFPGAFNFAVHIALNEAPEEAKNAIATELLSTGGEGIYPDDPKKQ